MNAAIWQTGTAGAPGGNRPLLARRCEDLGHLMGAESAGELRPTFWGANLQHVLDDFRSDADIPGLTAAILYEDMAPWSGAVGVAAPVGHRPMTPATLSPSAA